MCECIFWRDLLSFRLRFVPNQLSFISLVSIKDYDEQVSEQNVLFFF